jgi:hypothetical protein
MLAVLGGMAAQVREVSVDWPMHSSFAGARAIDAACPWTIRPVQRLARVVVVSANYASKQMNLFL